MFNFLKRTFTAQESATSASLGKGKRIYAIGDIHGRLDLFDAMIDKIEADDAAAGPSETGVILLGDLVDRGPHTAGVISRARQWQQERSVRILSGNHEELFMRSLEDIEYFRHFIRHGGRETMLSYGLSLQAYNDATLTEAHALLRQIVPAEDVAFLHSFEDMIREDDYLFVHAGIDPSLPLEEQTPAVVRWIREPFLSYDKPHGFVVVHGHTITDEPQDFSNRIGVDTGAYRSGRLTAVVLEGDQKRFIQVTDADFATA